MLSRTRYIGLVAALLVLITGATGCGEPEGELQILERKEPKTLLEEGSALTEVEASRRKKVQEESRAKAQVEQRLIKSASKLDAAKEVDTIVEALDRFRQAGPKAVGYFAKLEPFAGHEDADVRVSALAAMTAVDPAASYRYQRAALSDDSAMVRRRAVAIWAKSHPGDTDSIVGMLRDDDARVQYEVLQALAAGKPDISILSQVAKSVEDLDGSSAKAALMLVLPRRREVKEFDIMVEFLLDHQDETTRLKTSETLRKAKVMDDRIAIKVVQTAVEDPSLAVRRSCLSWLKDLSPKPLPAFDPDADDDGRMARIDVLSEFVKGLFGTWGN